MSPSKVEFFRSLLEAIPSIRETAASAFSEFREAFLGQINGQSPKQASDYAQMQLEKAKVDEQLLLLYEDIVELTSQPGDGLAEDMPIVEDAAAAGRKIASRPKLSAAISHLLAEAMGKAAAEDRKRRFLSHFLEQNAAKVQEQRIKQLENATSFGRSGEKAEGVKDSTSGSDYTLAQQALALQLLLTEGMEVSGVDQTKVIALAHLLSGKKIPIKAGKENIANSGIKSAFGKMWQKSDKGHLADLRFVLRFFKPFEGTSSEGMNRTIQAIEREIAKVEGRLRKASAKK